MRRGCTLLPTIIARSSQYQTNLAPLLVLFSKLWLLQELVKFLANSLKQGFEKMLMLFNLLNTDVM